MMKSNYSLLKRIISILLTLAMSASGFCGCIRSHTINNASNVITAMKVDAHQLANRIIDGITEEEKNIELPSDSTNWEEYLGDPETFVYGLIANQLEYHYDVFPAYVELLDGTEIYGIAYTDYNECYVNEDETAYCFKAGFIPSIGELSIPQEDFDAGLTVHDLEYSDDKGSFVLAYGSEAFTEHCVVYGQYLQYGIDDQGRIFYSVCDYSREVCDISLGSLYSYDQRKYLYDIDVGTHINVSGETLYSQIDFAGIEAEINRILETQDKNFVTVNVESCAYIAQKAVANYLLSLQEETFLGYSVAELKAAADTLDPMECYRLTEDGPVVLELDYDGGATSLTKWLVGTSCIIATAVAMVGAVVFIECPPLSATTGLIAGTAIEIFMEVVISGETLNNVNWGKVALAAAAGAVSGYLGPYIYATYSGTAYFAIDSSLDGFVGGIEHAVSAWMDGKECANIIKSFGYGFAMGFGLSAGFKAAGSVVEKIAHKIAPSIAKLTEKVLPKLTDKLSALSERFGSVIYTMKKAADSTVFHSDYIAHKLAARQLIRIIKDGSDELVAKSFMHLSDTDTIIGVNGEYISKNALKDLFDVADDGATLAYFKRGDELISIVKKNGMFGIVFDSSKYQTVTLPKGLINNRPKNMERAAEILRKQWINDSSLIPESLANKIKNSGINLKDMMPKDLVSIIQKSDWVLHENIDLKTVSLVPRYLHNKEIGGIAHMGGFALAKFLKQHMGIEFFERLVSAAATSAVLAA